jgi:hypothetical protein
VDRNDAGVMEFPKAGNGAVGQLAVKFCIPRSIGGARNGAFFVASLWTAPPALSVTLHKESLQSRFWQLQG